MTDKELRIVEQELAAKLAKALRRAKPKEPLLTSGLAVGQHRQWWKCCETIALACAGADFLPFLADCGYDGPKMHENED